VEVRPVTALEDLTRAADLLQPIFTRTNGVDGWVSLEVSPFLARPMVDGYRIDATLGCRDSIAVRQGPTGARTRFLEFQVGTAGRHAR
jgi:hypothetical protein